MERREFLLHAEIDGEALEAWIEAGWLMPPAADDFSDVDLARARRDFPRGEFADRGPQHVDGFAVVEAEEGVFHGRVERF